ncbi:MAG: site-specific integrase [Paracoccaceae bacterium]
MGRDPVVTSITREDARMVRGHMLDRVKVSGRGVGGKVSAATVSRKLSIITAVINFAKREFDLGETVLNAFNQVPVARVAKGQGQKASEKRAPLPPKVLAETRETVLANAAPELALVWRLIEGTGCRIAEVTGLRVEDVDASGDQPHIQN